MQKVTGRGTDVSWADFYQRRDAIDAALRHIHEGQCGPLPLGVFRDETELLLALHHKWLMALTGRMELALAETGDPVEAVAEAWRATATRHEALRRLLDDETHRETLRPAIEGEHRLLALSAELALPDEPTGEITAAGAAFLALVRSRPARRRNPVEQLLRRLVASA
jgi:hypothetical protein